MDELIAKLSKVPLIQRLLVAVGILGLIVVAVYFMGVAPEYEQAQRAQNEIDSLDAKLVKKKAIAKDLTRYQVEVERLKQKLNEALTQLPNQSEIPELLQKLATLVEQSDCQMAKFSPKGEIKQDFYARIPVEMQITGNYHSIALFFDRVSKLDRIVNVSAIKLEEPKLENKKVVLSAKFEATTFKFIDKPVGNGRGRRSPKR
jgi:type IV pilus assembly protein PilO